MGVINAMKLKLANVFPALTHHNFRYFWTGQCISLIGTWMQNVGQSWLVYTLTKSPFLLGLVGAMQFLPMMVFSLFAGVIIDKFPKKSILLFTQISLMVLALTLATLVATNTVQYWHVLILAFLLGCVNTLDVPTRQSFMIELVGKQDLMNAIALNSTIFNAARIIGPAVAGLMMGLLGIAFCFFANAASFLAVIYGITRIKVEPSVKKSKPNENVMQDIKEGLKYIFDTPLLYRNVLLVAVFGTFAMNYSVLIPVLARTVLNQQGTGFSFLMSSLGVGSFFGALLVATSSKSGPKSFTLFASALTVSVMLMIIPLSGVYSVTALCLAITGFFNIVFSATANSTIQINSKDEFRGRVMSVYALVFGGTTPIGSLITGTIANNYGARAGFIVNGSIVLILVSTLLFLKKREDKKAQLIRPELAN